MIELVMRSRLPALMLAIPLVASGAAGVVLHVCHAMEAVVAGDCGCDAQAPHAHEGHGEAVSHAAHESEAKLQTQPCCTVELSSGSQLVATQEVTWLQVEDAAVALVTPSASTVAMAREACDLGLLRERSPPNLHGPPIFVRNCSFLN
jgi:hypothetical protein